MNRDENFKHEILMPGRTVRDGLVYVGEQRIVEAGAPINPTEWEPGEAIPKRKIVLQRVWSCCGSPHAFHLSGCVHEKTCDATAARRRLKYHCPAQEDGGHAFDSRTDKCVYCGLSREYLGCYP